MIRLVFCLFALAAVPLQGQQLIWSSTENGEIWTSDLDGANARVLVDLDIESGQVGHEPRKLVYADANQRIYWTENLFGLPGIYSAKRDGSDVRTVVDILAVFGAGEYFTEGLAVVGEQLF